MANVRKFGYFRPERKDTPARRHRPGNPIPGRKRQEGDRNAKTLGKQLRV